MCAIIFVDTSCRSLNMSFNNLTWLVKALSKHFTSLGFIINKGGVSKHKSMFLCVGHQSFQATVQCCKIFEWYDYGWGQCWWCCAGWDNVVLNIWPEQKIVTIDWETKLNTDTAPGQLVNMCKPLEKKEVIGHCDGGKGQTWNLIFKQLFCVFRVCESCSWCWWGDALICWRQQNKSLNSLNTTEQPFDWTWASGKMLKHLNCEGKCLRSNLFAWCLQSFELVQF